MKFGHYLVECVRLCLLACISVNVIAARDLLVRHRDDVVCMPKRILEYEVSKLHNRVSAKMSEDVRKLQNQMAEYEYRLQAAEKLLEESKDRDKCTNERSHKDDIRRLLDGMSDKMSGDTNLLQYGMESINIQKDQTDNALFGREIDAIYSDKEWWRSRVITGIRITCMESKYFTGVQAQYGEDWAPPHGFPDDPFCNSYSLKWLNYTLDYDERITSVNMSYGMTDYGPDKIVHTFSVVTNKRALEPCKVDPTRLHYEKSTVSSGKRLEYISSSSGCSIYGIKLHW